MKLCIIWILAGIVLLRDGVGTAVVHRFADRVKPKSVAKIKWNNKLSTALLLFAMFDIYEDANEICLIEVGE